jgi:23S rRNA (uracil1939-C5)-methyltransferase
LRIVRLGHLGDGVAGDGTFAALTLPGELVEGAVVAGRIAEPKIVESSPDRLRPACPHYRACGGCSLMHASDGFVANWKADVVRTALAAHGLDAAFRPVITSPSQSRRRATFSGRRTKKGALVGFHGRASGTIADIPGCLLLHPTLVGLMPVLADIVVAGASRKAELALTATLSDSGTDLTVTGGKPLDSGLFSDLAALAERADLARLTWDGALVVERRPPILRFGSAQVILPPGAFLQATAEGEAALLTAVAEAVGPARTIADLFAGCGTFALPLAERATVHAAEGEAAMTAALNSAWRGSQDLHRISTETRDLFRRPLLPDELNGYDAVVVDPPRAGAEAQVTELAKSSVPVIAAVSCNPVTFARDARILSGGGYRIDWVQVVDQFRWSPHVELVARLSRQGFTSA